ncbi:PIN domain-containing protein [Moraxella bovis]|uniref:PIN domain n=2 Tax=Moraxella TaxID=475 RepID=A0A1T0A8B7_MORBO|nr:type II toxin-antitoxin system VapC family toxin [Moraxella bovis]OOR91571.1 hypothetical protein B0182_02555 [Moraxella bovis]UZA15660.1 type II toxin-antitoxin system VapC family toxin [Moraxella bovis]STY93301.1 PIN domain [Moraxella bovis]
MISLDTNILVRYLTKDDTVQYQKVVALFQKLHTDNEQGFISLLVVLEVNWVLAFSYKIPRNEIIHSLLTLLNFPFLTFEQANHLQQTLLYAQNNTFDLSDLLIACKSRSLDNLPVYTFDKKASRAEGFVLL